MVSRILAEIPFMHATADLLTTVVLVSLALPIGDRDRPPGPRAIRGAVPPLLMRR